MNEVHKNRLAAEKSPYLLQHASNPVDWYPWGDEAFHRAKTENKPVFLSIGYSTCHWCHVMAHESFEDDKVAALMNEVFIAIKVDREERPDIDGVYMNVCQMMTGSGGWPLTIIMTPDKQPFFAATYLPKETGFGRLGMLDLIPRVKDLWQTRQQEVVASALEITSSLKRVTPDTSGEGLNEQTLHTAYRELAERFDEQHGGFGLAPKFPTPHNLLFLMRYYQRTGEKKALAMVEKTLRAMRRGGVYDHIGYGIHRYSTDQQWLVPHFEKMLYDQALLATACTEAYQITSSKEYAVMARELFAYVLRDMTAPEGGFYSAEDADSEGEEGKFYLWTVEDIKNVLSAEEYELAVNIFNVSREGNFRGEVAAERTGRNILYLAKSTEEYALEKNISRSELEARIDKMRQKLFAYREKRVHPHKDDKVLTDWNGLMIAALAKGAQVFGETLYARAAGRAAAFVLDNMRNPEGRLLHRYRDGDAAINANIDDYAFFIHGLIELYQATFDAGYLESALQLNEDLLRHFWDEENGGFYYTADDSESLLIRQKEIYDGAVPSGNSMAMLNLLRLGHITGRTDFAEKANKIGQVFSATVAQSPSAYTQLMAAVDFATGPSYEIVIAGDTGAEDTRRMLAKIQELFIPNKVIVIRPSEEKSPAIDKLAPFVSNYSPIEGKSTAYVCINHNCKLPTTDIGTMLTMIGTGPDPARPS